MSEAGSLPGGPEAPPTPSETTSETTETTQSSPEETRFGWRCPACGWDNQGVTRAVLATLQTQDFCRGCRVDRQLRGIDVEAPPGAMRIVALPPRKPPKNDYISEEPWDGILRRDFESKLFDTRAWLRQSDGLMAAAALFEPTMEEDWQKLRAFAASGESNLPTWDSRAVYFMLVGLAVENLLKGALVSHNVPRLGAMYFLKQSALYGKVSQGDLPGLLKTHDLLELVRLLGVKYSPEEEDLLHRLTRAVEWHARYPVPVRYEDLEGARTFSDGKRYSISYSSEDDVERVKRFVDDLSERVGRVKNP